jgi:nicotinamide riboside kinase
VLKPELLLGHSVAICDACKTQPKKWTLVFSTRSEPFLGAGRARKRWNLCIQCWRKIQWVEEGTDAHRA